MNILSRSDASRELLKYKIIELSPNNPFTFASGIKSPIYCDGRKIISNPGLRMDIALSMAEQIRHSYPGVEVISGVATGSIAMAAWISQILNLPMIYYRKPKGYGHNNTIEGDYQKGQNVVVVEDTVSTGGSCLTAVQSLRQSGLNVLGVSFIYSHEMQKSTDNFASENCKYTNLCGLSDIISYAYSSGILTEEEVALIKEWKKSPSTWGI